MAKELAGGFANACRNLAVEGCVTDDLPEATMAVDPRAKGGIGEAYNQHNIGLLEAYNVILSQALDARKVELRDVAEKVFVRDEDLEEHIKIANEFELDAIRVILQAKQPQMTQVLQVA